MESKSIDISLEYKEEVLRDFFKFQMNVRQHTKWLFYGTGVIAIGIGVIMWKLVDMLSVGIACAIIGLLIIVNYPFQIRRAVKNQDLKGLYRPGQRLRIDHLFLIQYVDKKELTYEWNAIILACETKNYFYLYNSKYGALILQKKELSEADLIELKEIIKENKIKYRKYMLYR